MNRFLLKIRLKLANRRSKDFLAARLSFELINARLKTCALQCQCFLRRLRLAQSIL